MAVGVLTPGKVHLRQEHENPGAYAQEEVASEPVLDNMWSFSGHPEDRKAHPRRVWSTYKPGRPRPPKSGLCCRVQAEDLKMVYTDIGMEG